MSAVLDHLVVAARTLSEGEAWLSRLGVSLQAGGEHTLFGTHNMLLSLGPSAYLELIAVNPQAPTPTRPRWFGLDTPEMGERLARSPALIHWVVRVPKLEGPDVLELSRGPNRWRLTVPSSGLMPMQGAEPSLIQWLTPPPPTQLPDLGLRLRHLQLGVPKPTQLRQRLAQLDFKSDFALDIKEQPEVSLQAVLESVEGRSGQPIVLGSQG